MKIAITTTTIFSLEPFLESYTENIDTWNHKKDVTIYIAGDRKSPQDSGDISKKYINRGFNIRYLDIDWQKKYLDRFPELKEIIPENSDNRRNVAYLIALDEGADVVISVDDDNFPILNQDFISEHLNVGKLTELPDATGSDGWFNLCSLLTPKQPDENLYPRGFPYKFRKDGSNIIGEASSGKIAVNVGLWTLDPDTDAIGRLYAHPHILDWKKQNVFLGKKIRCPINTQNTALSRDAMLAYYYVNMGDSLKGMKLDRFGDIFSGYFLQVCVESVGERIRIGSPIAEHRRNKHNLFIDLYNELAGIMLTEDLADFLTNVKLPSTSYYDAYTSLSIQLEDFSNMQDGFIWENSTKEFFRKTAKNMRIWADVVQMVK